MPRNRTPLALAELTGQIERKPGRYKNRIEPKAGDIGVAPENFNEPLKLLWESFKADIPWLKSSDRKILGIACHLQHKINTENDLPVSAYAQLRMTLSALGATPVDRNRIADAEPEEKEYDPLDEFMT